MLYARMGDRAAHAKVDGFMCVGVGAVMQAWTRHALTLHVCLCVFVCACVRACACVCVCVCANSIYESWV